MKAAELVEAVLTGRVTWVVEEGTADAFQAIYIDGVLVVENPRRDVMDVLEALHVKIDSVYIAKGFDGNFPRALSDLDVYTR